MKALSRHLVVVLLMLIFLLSAFFFIPTDLLIPKHSRTLEWARSSTEAKIWKFEKMGYSDELRRWIENRHDGGISIEVAFSYFEWGMKNPEGFDSVTSSIEPIRRKEVIEWLCGTVGKTSDQTREFVESRNEPTFVEFRKCMWR